MTRILGAAPPSAPIAIPKNIRPLQPEQHHAFAYRTLPPRVRMAWQADSALTGYRLQLARDQEFRDLVFDEQLAAATFVHGNLRAGDYYWRVSGIRETDEGDYSPVRHFRLIQDEQPPKLEVNFPTAPVTTASLELTGVSEPDSQVFIGGQKIESSRSGAFRYILPIVRGINVVVVEAVDQAGNVSYKSEMINGLY